MVSLATNLLCYGRQFIEMMRTLTDEDMGNLPSFLFNREEDDPYGTITSLEDIPTLVLDDSMELPYHTLRDETMEDIPLWVWKAWPTLSDRLDCTYVVSDYEDDTDSGYHTAHSTLKGASGKSRPPPPPGPATLSREDLRNRIDSFNTNQHGLLMTMEMGSSTDTSTLTPNGHSKKSTASVEPPTFQGFIRVYMNLMRPISMSLPARPPSIYDVMGENTEPTDTLTTSFYLPKDTTKVIHISSDTTASEVIRALLQKFKITDNPRKFALYEKIEEDSRGERPVNATMRRVCDEEWPLQLCLAWTSEGLNNHKFVLQENDTGEIMWEAFSVPELENFLRILDREEAEYVGQLKAKYQLLKIQTHKQLKRVEPEHHKQASQDNTSQSDGSNSKSCDKPGSGGEDGETLHFTEDTREPVFV